MPLLRDAVDADFAMPKVLSCVGELFQLHGVFQNQGVQFFRLLLESDIRGESWLLDRCKVKEFRKCCLVAFSGEFGLAA